MYTTWLIMDEDFKLDKLCFKVILVINEKIKFTYKHLVSTATEAEKWAVTLDVLDQRPVRNYTILIWHILYNINI